MMGCGGCGGGRVWAKGCGAALRALRALLRRLDHQVAVQFGAGLRERRKSQKRQATDRDSCAHFRDVFFLANVMRESGRVQGLKLPPSVPCFLVCELLILTDRSVGHLPPSTQ